MTDRLREQAHAVGPLIDSLSFEPLSPLLFLDRAAHVFRDRVAVVDGSTRRTYAELRERTRRQSGALRELHIEAGDRVAVLSPNTPLLLDSHYVVPGCGAVLVALNYRLQAGELAQIVAHSGATTLLFDSSLAGLAADILARVESPPTAISDHELDRLAAVAQPYELRVEDERSLLSLNYTSGTTGVPKGVMYHHRGAYLQALAMALHARLDARSVFLWTLPMFHCNGWCFTWAVTAVGGTHVCLPKIDPELIWRLIRAEGVTHLNAAPTVLLTIASAGNADAAAGAARIRICTGGAPPSPTLIQALDDLDMDVTHLYGLTETFGPIMICDPQPDWGAADPPRLASLLARQGVANIAAVAPRVVAADGTDVPADGATPGEIAVRGNQVMLGYYNDPESTAAAAPDGWFRTGDIAVMHADGYIEIRDRAKDIIISGGENIASVEVEQAILSHPGVLEAAVVAGPDERWGEVPVAFVTLREGHDASPAELIAHVKDRVARFKAPKRVIFGPLPKNATGKILKYSLREQLWADHGGKRIG